MLETFTECPAGQIVKYKLNKKDTSQHSHRADQFHRNFKNRRRNSRNDSKYDTVLNFDHFVSTTIDKDR